MTASKKPLTVAEAEAALADIEAKVAGGDLGPEALGEAQHALAAAVLRQEHDEKVAQLRAGRENVEAIQAELDWLNGPDLDALVDRLTLAELTAVDALADYLRAWKALAVESRQRLLHLRQLGLSGQSPPGVQITPSLGMDVQVDHPTGQWLSATLATTDPLPPVLEAARVVAAGGTAKLSVTNRVKRWLTRGRGVALPAPGDEGQAA